MISKDVVVQCESGLHARPAANVMKTAKKFSCKVIISKDGRQANAKSLVEILGLGAYRNDTVTICCDGEDEEAAMEQLVALVQDCNA